MGRAEGVSLARHDRTRNNRQRRLFVSTIRRTEGNMNQTKGNNVKRPAFQFYPGDWMKDPAVRSLTFAERGLWIDLLCMMHESPERGVLVNLDGQPLSVKEIARMVGTSNVVGTLLASMERRGVFSRRDDGAIFSRRMVKDERIRSARANAGRASQAKQRCLLEQNKKVEGGERSENSMGQDTVTRTESRTVRNSTGETIDKRRSQGVSAETQERLIKQNASKRADTLPFVQANGPTKSGSSSSSSDKKRRKNKNADACSSKSEDMKDASAWMPYAEDVRQKYPKLRRGRPGKATKAISEAMARLCFREGVGDPVAYLMKRTKAYAEQVRTANLAYIPLAATWFDEDGFDGDQDEWAIEGRDAAEAKQTQSAASSEQQRKQRQQEQQEQRDEEQQANASKKSIDAALNSLDEDRFFELAKAVAERYQMFGNRDARRSQPMRAVMFKTLTTDERFSQWAKN
jgi:hypothetical protein